MLFSPPRTDRRPAGRAFTLVEVLVAVGLSGLVLAGVLTAGVQLTRSSVRITRYAEMDTQVRRAFEQLSLDLKSASDLTWNGASDITVTIPLDAATTKQITYAWNSTTQSFFRVPGASSATVSGRVQLITGIPALANGSPGLTFARQDQNGNTASTNAATKSIQVTLVVSRAAGGAVSASSRVTATFMLRNKPVS